MTPVDIFYESKTALVMTMSRRWKATLCLCFLLVWDRTVLLGTCSQQAQTSDGDTFTIQHTATGNCLVGGASTHTGVGLASCDITTGSQLWKWGSGHRLFHVGTTLCLGLEVRPLEAVSLLDCGSGSRGGSGALSWRCLDGAIYSAPYRMGLSVNDREVSVKRNSSDSWTADGSRDNICQRPYRTVHTTNGNSAGAPCEFPFLLRGAWHHQCLPDEDSPGLSWCSTTTDYGRDRKRGTCLKPEEGCHGLFVGAEGSCYEFVSAAAVTWQGALDSCRSQGAELLSLSGPEQVTTLALTNLLLDRMPDRMWIGLHQLDQSQGWQWSDGTPLSYLRWESGMPFTSITESDCGVLNSKQNYESEACDKRLPYICKKNVNSSQSTATELSLYKTTMCAKDWIPWSGWCYKLVKDEVREFVDAQSHCESIEGGGGGALASLHSMDTKEMISSSFHTAGALDVWIGLIGTVDYLNFAVFSWVDQAPVTFTYWDPGQPSQPKQDPSCVFYSGELHGWRVGNCSQKLPFLCQKRGVVNESATEAGCPPEGGWRRHGNSCYKVVPKEVSFKDRCDIIIRNGFEQAFISRLLGEHIGMETLYFWIGLQDADNADEYRWLSLDGAEDAVTYTNWGSFEPARDGGCAVMSTAKPLGRWEVKNCTLFKAGTICKRDIGEPPTPEPEPSDTIPCPDGWISRPGIKYCYKVFHEERLSRKRSWEEAERFCQALGANLPSFMQHEEMRAMHYVMRDTISDERFFWVGLNKRNPADRSWVWSDGRPVSMAILHQDFHEDDAYNRDCTAFKTMKNSLKSLFVFLLHDIPPRPFYATPFHCDAKLEWVCQIPRGKTPKIPEWYNPGGHHETSIFVDSREFWFVTAPTLTFEEARLYCSTNNSTLATPQSFTAARQIHQAIMERSNFPKQSWWADMRQPGRFFPLTFTQMHFYHSAFLGRCTSLSPENIFPEYEYSCERRLPFVCETHNITSVERNPGGGHPGALPCGNGSLAFRDKCYTLLKPSVEMSFGSANERCHSLRGSLVTISDQVEQDFVTSLLLQLPDIQKTWIGLKLKMEEPEWVDETPVTFLNLNPLLHGLFRPVRINALDPESMELCVFIINDPKSPMMGSWDYNTCSERQPVAICQHHADKTEEPRVPSEPIHTNNHTFQLLRNNLTFWEALAECQSKKMDLASVADTSQQSILTVYVNRAQAPMWIGLFSDDGIHYRWTDESHTTFSRWSPEATSGSCVYMDTDGFWKSTECQETLPGAICHVPHKETTTTPESETVKCPHKINGPNWIPFKKNCYFFQMVSSRWDQFDRGQIHDTCKNIDAVADILTIRNAEENEFVRQQLLPFKNLVQFIWLGLFKDDNDDGMKWYDGTNVQYSNWRDGRPEVDGEFMAGLDPDGVWELVTNTRYFRPFKQQSIVVCKLDNDPKEEYSQSVKDIESYGNLTYEVVTKKLSWFQALEECGGRGGHLASVHDAQHDAHLELIAKTDGFPLWIGLSNQHASGSVYEWSDGTRYDYRATIWESLEGSSPQRKQGGCVFVNTTGSWVKTDCNAVVNGAICYSTTITTPSQRAKLVAAPVHNNCPQSSGLSKWVEYKHHCYAFDMSLYNYTVYSMDDARSICLSLDAHLLTIMTKDENDFVSEYMSENPLITSRAWLGMDLDTQGTPVAWVDGSALAFSNWGPRDLVAGETSEPPCAVMVSADRGVWSRVGCKESHSRVVCKAAARSAGSPVALGFFVVVLLALLAAIGALIYKKKRAYFTSTIRYKKNFDEAGTTSIITDDE